MQIPDLHSSEEVLCLDWWLHHHVAVHLPDRYARSGKEIEIAIATPRSGWHLAMPCIHHYVVDTPRLLMAAVKTNFLLPRWHQRLVLV